VAAPVQRTPGRRPLPVAVDTSRPDTDLLDTDLLDTDLLDTDGGSGSSSGQLRRPRCSVPQPPRHRPRCPAGAGRRRTRSRRCGATAGPRSRICSSALVKLPARRSQRNGCPDAWTPDAACRTPRARTPGAADTRDRRRAWGLDRVVDRAEQAHSVRAPDCDLMVLVDPRSSANILDCRMAHAGGCAGHGPLPTTGRKPCMTCSTP
jgi:hypothetical protein